MHVEKASTTVLLLSSGSGLSSVDYFSLGLGQSRHKIASFTPTSYLHDVSFSKVIALLQINASIMAIPGLAVRLRYLNESAHLLATTAPTTSRHLMARCSSLISENQIDRQPDLKKSACSACGSIIMPGWNCTVRIEGTSKRRDKRKVEKSGHSNAKVTVYKCEVCGMTTRFPLGTLQRIKNAQDSSKPAPAKTSTTPNAESKVTPSAPVAESGNKKRSRKKRQRGLDAILAKQRASDTRGSGGFGLDLMDFMKQG